MAEPPTQVLASLGRATGTLLAWAGGATVSCPKRGFVSHAELHMGGRWAVSAHGLYIATP